MTAKEYCMNHPAIAYASRNAGLEIHGIEYGINDYVYTVSGAWAGTAAHSFHRARIDYTASGQDCTNGRKYRYSIQYNPLALVHTWVIRQPMRGGSWEWVQPLAMNLQFTPRNSTR